MDFSPLGGILRRSRKGKMPYIVTPGKRIPRAIMVCFKSVISISDWITVIFLDKEAGKYLIISVDGQTGAVLLP